MSMTATMSTREDGMFSLRCFLPALLACLCGHTLVLAGDSVKVDGSDYTFKKELTRQVGKQKSVSLKLTGVALYEKWGFHNIFAVGSYVKKDSKVKTAAALAAADTPKVLVLTLEHDLSGKSLADGFRDAIRANYPKGFNKELKKLSTLSALALKAGQHVRFVHLPGIGLRCEFPGKSKKKPLVIKNLKFASAVWNMFLGKKNLGASIKKKLVERLK